MEISDKAQKWLDLMLKWAEAQANHGVYSDEASVALSEVRKYEDRNGGAAEEGIKILREYIKKKDTRL